MNPAATKASRSPRCSPYLARASHARRTLLLGRRRFDLDDKVLHQRLVALSTVVADGTKHVQLRHVTHRGTGWQVVGNGAIAAHTTSGTVLGKARKVHEVVFLQAAILHVVLIHKDQRTQVLDAPVTI